MTKVVVYGLGGYDPSKPNNNVVDEYDLPDEILPEQEVVRQSALNKLLALGLTVEEIEALIQPK